MIITLTTQLDFREKDKGCRFTRSSKNPRIAVRNRSGESADAINDQQQKTNKKQKTYKKKHI